MKTHRFSVQKRRFLIEASVQEVGADLLVVLWGGTRPHIGAVGIAVPRPSLADPTRWSATSSNFTFVGHKEDLLAKEVSETLAGALQKNVVVTAGIHWDDLKPGDLGDIQEAARTLARRIAEGFQAGKARRSQGRRSRA